MGVGVNARTAFSLLFPPILDEFGWPRGVTAGAFSFGFFVSALLGPFLGRLMDRRGPRAVMLLGVALVCAGLGLAPRASAPWHLYLTLGVLVAGGTVLPGLHRTRALSAELVRAAARARDRHRVLRRRRGRDRDPAVALVADRSSRLARGGPGDGRARRRDASPAELLHAPAPGGPGAFARRRHGPRVRDSRRRAPVERRRSRLGGNRLALARAMQTARFWWVAIGFAASLFAWYAVQVHQTKYLMEIGFAPAVAAGALGLVAFTGIVGQIALGHLSDRIGREWMWTLSCAGFMATYALLLVMREQPTPALLYLMVAAQGVLGYGLASIFGGAIGPWVAGALHDRTGSYVLAFWIAIAVSAVSAAAIWLAAPRKVRAVAGRVPRGL
jgi:MFS family permease